MCAFVFKAAPNYRLLKSFQSNWLENFEAMKGCAMLKGTKRHEVPRKNVFKATQKKSSPVERKKGKEEEELQWSFANCLRRSAVKIRIKLDLTILKKRSKM